MYIYVYQKSRCVCHVDECLLIYESSFLKEWGTLMFFMNKEAMNGGSKGRDKMNSRGGSEQLAIFGNKRARRGAELKAPRWIYSRDLDLSYT